MITKGDIMSLYIAMESRGPTASEYNYYMVANSVDSPSALLKAYRHRGDSKFPEYNSTTYGDCTCPLDGDTPGRHAWHMAIVEIIYNNAFNKTIFARKYAYDTAEDAINVNLSPLCTNGHFINNKLAGVTIPHELTPGGYVAEHCANILGDNPTTYGKYIPMFIGVNNVIGGGAVDLNGETLEVHDKINTTLSSALYAPFECDSHGGKYWATRLSNGDENTLNSIVSMILSGAYIDAIENMDDDLLTLKMEANRDVINNKVDFTLSVASTSYTEPYITLVGNPSYVDDETTPDENQYIPRPVNISYVSSVSSISSIVRTITDSDSKVVALGIVLPDPVNYKEEYEKTYSSVVNTQMRAMREQLKDLFELIDSGDTEQIPIAYNEDGSPVPVTTDITNNSEQLTTREKLSLKKDAYMQVLAQVNNNANTSTLTVLDKVHKFKYELETTAAQSYKMSSEVKLTDSKREVMEQQVVDNRRIKAMSSLGDTYGTMMAGGLVPTSSMWSEYFRLSKELTLNGVTNDKLMQYRGVWRPECNSAGTAVAGTTEPKYFEDGTHSTLTDLKTNATDVGNYWKVDLSGWLLTAPGAKIYLGRVTNSEGTHNADGSQNTSNTGDYTTNPNATNLQKYPSVFAGSETEMTTTELGGQIPTSLVGTVKPATKTDIAGSLCSISLDGVSYWRHGDIVYVEEITTGTDSVTNAYRRVAGFSASNEVTVAPEPVSNDDTGVDG